MEGFIGGQVWPELTAMARACRHRRRVAVAYLGADATDVLPLRRNDVLVLAATQSNALAGAINPDSLQDYLDGGVELWAHETLHAKVFRLGPVTVVGSPNASPTSTRLEEAAIISHSKATAAKADAFIDGLIAESVPVDDQLIAGLRSAWNRRTRRGAPGVTERPPAAWPAPTQRVFIYRSYEDYLTPAQQRALDEQENHWRRRAGSKSRWALESHVSDLDEIKQFRASDILIYDYTPIDRGRELWPPAEALTDPVRLGRTSAGVLPLKMLKDIEPVDYAEANATLLRTAGRGIGRARRVADQRQIDALFALFNLPRSTSTRTRAT